MKTNSHPSPSVSACSATTSAAATVETAFMAMDDAFRVGRVVPADIADVKAAIQVGVPHPKGGKKPFARRDEELRDVPPDDWAHYLAALEQMTDPGQLWARSELTELMAASTDEEERLRIDGKLRFQHFLLNAVRNALYAAKMQLTTPGQKSKHPPISIDRVRSLLDSTIKRNIAGDPRQGRAPQDPTDAAMAACRYMVGMLLRPETVLASGVTHEQLLNEVRLVTVSAFIDSIKKTNRRGRSNEDVHTEAERAADEFLLDADQSYRRKLGLPQARSTDAPASMTDEALAASPSVPPPSARPSSRRVARYTVAPDGVVDQVTFAEVAA